MLRLEAERRAREWSKTEFSRRADLAPATVIEATNGKRRPGQIQLLKLARALGWPEDRAAELLEEVPDNASD